MVKKEKNCQEKKRRKTEQEQGINERNNPGKFKCTLI
jgi:hypothetical protein